MSIGDALAAARRQAGLTVTQVSQRTCIRETIVRGIERGDYSACGGDFYARGHIRSIARAVGADPEELIREYDATEAPAQPITAADVFQPFTPVKLRERRRANWSVVLLVGVVAVLGIVGFRFFSTRHPSHKPPVAAQSGHHPSASATPADSKPAAPPAPTHVRITLAATAGNVTWAEATTANGTILFSGDVYSAAAETWTSKHDITLQLGNPAGATLYLNGKRQRFSQNTQPITVVCGLKACRTAQLG